MFLLDLDRLPYREAWELQKATVAAKKVDNYSIPDVLLLLEHPPVLTLGRRGGMENILVSQDELRMRGIELFHVERGGDVTYHGPGQLVGYPIMDLRTQGLRVVDFVHALDGARSDLEGLRQLGKVMLNGLIWLVRLQGLNDRVVPIRDDLPKLS